MTAKVKWEGEDKLHNCSLVDWVKLILSAIFGLAAVGIAMGALIGVTILTVKWMLGI